MPDFESYFKGGISLAAKKNLEISDFTIYFVIQSTFYGRKKPGIRHSPGGGKRH